jgi:threonine/homoserine/homoserine lactone efflux protein
MITFAAAVFFLLITPGPGVLTIAGVGAAFGWRAGMHFFVGLFVGTNLVALAVVSGLAAIVLANDNIRFVLFVASACYLIYLAARIALSGARIAFIKTATPPGFWGAIMLQAINPKAYAVNTTLFGGFAFLPENLATETLIKFLIINLIWIPVHLLWLHAGVTLHRLDLRAKTQAAINIAMALSMLAVVALAVLAPK